MSEKTKSSPAVDVARRLKSNNGVVEIILPSGDKAVLHPVSASLINAVTSKIKDPDPPMWYNKEYDREEPNPSDPRYQQALDDANTQRGIAAMDAMVMFGVDLVDGLPEDDSWLRKLKLMEKQGLLELSAYDMNDDLNLEFLYKRFIAVDTFTINKISEISGVSAEEIEEAERSFRGD